jgi:hypothetical protein
MIKLAITKPKTFKWIIQSLNYFVCKEAGYNKQTPEHIFYNLGSQPG